LQIQAYDPESGQIAQVKIQEASATYYDSILYDFQLPQNEIDAIIPYELSSDEHEQIELTLNVIDVAGQHSETLSISLFWWHLVEMVCFPNPFNPDLGEVSTIEAGDLEVDEARIFDLFGNLVIKLEKNRSSSFFQWDGRNSDGKPVSNGGYFCVINTDKKQYCKIAVLR